MDIKQIKQEVWESAKKHKEWSMIFSDIFARPLAVFIIRFIKITPNQLTLFSFLLALIGSFFVYQGGYQNLVIGAAILFLYNVLDMIDGILARVTKQTSRVGMWLDGFIGSITFPVVIIALALSLNNYIALILGMLAIMSYPMQYSLVHYFNADIVNEKDKIPLPSKLEWARYVYGSSFFYVFFIVAALLNRPYAVLWFWAIFGNLYWMATAFMQYRAIRNT